MPAVAEKVDVYSALPVDLRERFDRARGDIGAITDWLDGEDLQVTDEGAEQVCAWAEEIASAVWGEPLVIGTAAEPEQTQLDVDREPIAETHYTPPGEEAEVVFELHGGEIRMVLKVSREQFFELERRGRDMARYKGTVYPIGPWSDELCVRWAVKEAVAAYLATPSLPDSNTHEEAGER